MSSGNEKLSSGVVELPPGDAIVANSKKSEKPGSNGNVVTESGDDSNILQSLPDMFDGVIVDPDCLPPDVPTFVTCLTTSIALWKHQVHHVPNYL